LPLYRRVGNILSEAMCIGSLGDIFLGRVDLDTAEARYKEALPLHCQMGDILGEANCIQGLGDVALLRGLSSQASENFTEALRLFEKIAEPYSIGVSHVRLARLATDLDTREKHLRAAREAWMQIDRPDLIETLDKEFNPTENTQ
jgi:tetratricopeptide (TPR) repeat protein